MSSLSEEAPGLRTLRLLVWWSTAGLVYAAGLTVAVLLLWVEEASLLLVSVVVGLLVTAGTSGWLLTQPLQRGRGDGEEGPASSALPSGHRAVGYLIAGGGAAAATTWALPALGVPAAATAFVPATFTAAVMFAAPRPARLPVTATGAVATVALSAVGSWLATGSVPTSLLYTAVLITGGVSFTMASWVWIWDAARRLEHARRLSADLAVAEERLRFAAELHDIQGHHLQVIALKSELAARLAEHDAAAAAEHMKAVHELARTALADTREVVRGYRRVSLAAELANAAKVLTAAGIHCPPPDEHASTQLPEQVRRLLGLAVREATTNVLRHSDATAADLQLRIKGNTAQLVVHNNGVRTPHRGGGTGLASLAERFADAGGTLDCTREGEVFDLVGTVPIGGNVRA